jgi:hypothetical protein
MSMRMWLTAVAVVGFVLAGTHASARQISDESPVIADIGFAFTVGDKVMPAGKYQIEVPEGGLVMFRPMKEKGVATAHVITRLAQSGHAPEDNPRVVFDRIGDKYIAAEVWFPDTDGYLIAGSKAPHTHHAVKITKTT